jgi:hypothetical protein
VADAQIGHLVGAVWLQRVRWLWAVHHVVPRGN